MQIKTVKGEEVFHQIKSVPDDETFTVETDNSLRLLQKKLEEEYKRYRSGKITEKEYLERAKPIDKAIGNLEMAILRGTLAAQRSSSLPSEKQKY